MEGYHEGFSGTYLQRRSRVMTARAWTRFGHSRYSSLVVGPLIRITRLFRHLKTTFAFSSHLVQFAERIVYR